MPCFRGIDVFIGTESELERLPEYPHPDSSSVSLVHRGQPVYSPSPRASSVHFGSEKTPTSGAKANPRVSMYVPSLPGIRFWIQYSIVQVPTAPCQLYFKLSSNGRHVTSWGVDPARTTTGTVAKGLYEPDESWHYRDEDEDMLRREGIESRLFHFADSSTNSSPAQDGGMLEVQIFRAKGRRRCAPRLQQSRDLDECGILSPSGSLLERPEDAAFYDWLLLDPRGSPYVTFRFYHRSWAGLRRLSVIPPPRTANSAGPFQHGASDGVPTTPPAGKSTLEPVFENESLRVDENDRTPKTGIEADSAPKRSPSKRTRPTWALTNPPELLQARSSSPCLPQPSKKARDGFLDRGLGRPLPALPSRPSRLKRSPPGPSLSAAPPGIPRMPTGNRVVPGAVEQRPGRILVDQPESPPSPSRHRAGSSTKTQPASPKHEPTPAEAQCVENPGSKVGPPEEAPGQAMAPSQLEPIGMLVLPRGLLGSALTEIPLRGPTGELMKKLRSEDPFRDD